ncbi:MAG TPA: hypothetical protein VHE37_08640, partial [Nevskiaceae bacterium]|nr:hypothetical protein [Nevskiaceae bacterium]
MLQLKKPRGNSMRSLTCGLLAALLVVSCGGGGGSAGPAQAPSPAVPPAQDSFYLPFFTGDGRLQLINPATPTAAPSTLDSGLDVQQAERFARGTYQASGPVVLSDAHFSDLVYIKQGHVYRMGLGGLPAVQQISAIDNACQLLPLFADYKNFDHSLLRVVVADPGQTCSSSSFSTRVVIGLAAGTSDPGVTVGRVVALARDYNADGSLAGEVVNESGTIRFYDANFANPQNIAANVADV